jgi:hypothetical protein
MVRQFASTKEVPAVLYRVDETAAAVRLCRSLTYELIRTGQPLTRRRRAVRLSKYLTKSVVDTHVGEDAGAAYEGMEADCMPNCATGPAHLRELAPLAQAAALLDDAGIRLWTEINASPE